MQAPSGSHSALPGWLVPTKMAVSKPVLMPATRVHYQIQQKHMRVLRRMDDVGGDEDACGFGIAVEASQKESDGGLDVLHALGSICRPK